jgi:uncharacterized protein (TIGR00269 family)
MNIFKAQTELQARIGPVSGLKNEKEFTKRVKPLYLLKEKEVKAYTLLKGFNITFSECTYSHLSFRSEVQKSLNDYESKHNGAKFNLITNFLRYAPDFKKRFKTHENISVCSNCGEPSAKNECRTCQILKKITS